MYELSSSISSGVGFQCICKCPAKLQIKKAKNKPTKPPSLFYAFFDYLKTLSRYPLTAL